MKSEREINIFSISFLDVFCCALGAMILIFVLNSQTLTNYLKDSIRKYKEKAREAQREHQRAIVQRNAAQLARNRAGEAEKLAVVARNLAEKAQKNAEKNQKLARLASEDAERHKKLAQQATRNAEVAREKALSALERANDMSQQLSRANQQLQEKNSRLEKINATLRQMIQESKSQDQKIKAMLERYVALQKNYQQLQEKKQELQQAISSLNHDKERLERERANLENWYKQAQEKIASLSRQYEGAVEQNDTLSDVLKKKQDALAAREREIYSKEKQIRAREQDIKAKERQINALHKLLEKKSDKSLFGIKLTYQRIMFLVDRSGSIIQNSWKQVVLDTCKEILQHCEVDEFAIIAFSSDMAFFPPRRGLTASGSQEQKEKAMHWLSSDVRFGGATHLHEALALAYEEYGSLDAIFILTDGLPSARGRSSRSLQRQIIKYIEAQTRKKVKTKIIAIAIGYPPNTNEYSAIYKYLHQISRLTGGQYLGR